MGGAVDGADDDDDDDDDLTLSYTSLTLPAVPTTRYDDVMMLM